MAQTKIVLDRDAQGRIFSFGSTAASDDALVTINKGIAALSTVVLDVKGSQNIAGDLNLIGNLNITGAINEQSVTNLYVTDINITLNKGGSTASAASAGLIIEGDSASTIGKLLYDGTLSSKWKIGDGTTQVEVVTISGTQTLTNKTITGGQISGNITGNSNNVTGTVLVANGGTGATTLTGYVKGSGTSTLTASSIIPGSDISGNISGNSVNVTGIISVVNGGTGLSTLILNSLIVGNGTSTPLFIAPGSNGNILTSNGTTWTSAAPAIGTVTKELTISGTQDGSNKVFTIGNTITANSGIVFVNGVARKSGSSNDFLISGTTLTFQAAMYAPSATDTIMAYGAY